MIQVFKQLFAFSFENEGDRNVHTGYYRLKVEIKDYNAMNDGKTFFDQPFKNDIRTLDNIQKVLTGQGDDYRTGCLLDYNYFREPYKIMAINLSKQEELDSDPKAVQHINFTGNLDRAKGLTTLFILEEVKETVSDFSQGTVKVF